MTPSVEPTRHRIDNVAALLRVMHADKRYALALHRHAEEHITLLLRRKFFRVPPELIGDAFNEAFLQLLRSKTFRDDVFQQKQPQAGWTAVELVKEVLGGYLYRSALYETLRLREKHLGKGGEASNSPSDEPDYAPASAAATAHESRPQLLDGTSVDLDTIADPELPLDDGLAHKQALTALYTCIGALAPTDRQIMHMYMAETPIADIAARVDEPNANNIKTRLHRLRQRVIECAQRRMR